MTALLALLVIGTTIWVGFDANDRDWTNEPFCKGPWQWMLASLLLWIVVFPIYLVKRRHAEIRR
jgi:hypothetical protein